MPYSLNNPACLCRRVSGIGPFRAVGKGSGVAAVLATIVGSVLTPFVTITPFSFSIELHPHACLGHPTEQRWLWEWSMLWRRVTPHSQAAQGHPWFMATTVHGALTHYSANSVAVPPPDFPQTHRSSCRASNREPSKSSTGLPLSLVPKGTSFCLPPTDCLSRIFRKS